MTRHRPGDLRHPVIGRDQAEEEAFRVRKSNKSLKESRKRRKRVYRLKNGLVSLKKTPRELVSVVRENSLSPLLRLPAEIRTLIWEHTLGGMRVLCSTYMGAYFRPHGADDPEHYRFHADSQLALLRVCRQIYNETATLTFSANLFCFFGRQALEGVWKSTRPAQRDAVRSMVVDRPLMLYYLRPKTKLKRLFSSPCDAFPNLKTIVIEPRSFEDSQKNVEEFLEMIEEVCIAKNLDVRMYRYERGVCE